MTHHVGNKSREEGVRLSDTGTSIKRDALEPLMDFLTSPFKSGEFFNFSLDPDIGNNEVYEIVKGIFNSQDNFVQDSQKLAQLLYDHQEHSSIKDGKLLVVRMEEGMLDGEVLDVIGIFKAETLSPFLKIDPTEETFVIDMKEGFDIKSLDKGCIIFDSEPEKGFHVLMHNSKSKESGFWGDQFLKVKESSDAYHQTKDLMHIAKDFVSEQMPQEFEVDKAERIALLNKSMEYFQQNNSFNKEEFAAEVFEDEKVVESFSSFDNKYRQENLMEPTNNFEISAQAVKKQGGVFKSVLKLDKNFHIYIHGDKNLIERGTDDEGRKFYKLYFEQEK